jgi:hypothetical protein
VRGREKEREKETEKTMSVRPSRADESREGCTKASREMANPLQDPNPFNYQENRAG